MLRRSFWPRHPSHKLHLFFQQWGLLAEEQWVHPPLTPPNELLCVVAIHETATNTTTKLANELGTVRFKIHNDFSSGNDGTNKSRCIIVCR